MKLYSVWTTSNFDSLSDLLAFSEIHASVNCNYTAQGSKMPFLSPLDKKRVDIISRKGDDPTANLAVFLILASFETRYRWAVEEEVERGRLKQRSLVEIEPPSVMLSDTTTITIRLCPCLWPLCPPLPAPCLMPVLPTCLCRPANPATHIAPAGTR